MHAKEQAARKALANTSTVLLLDLWQATNNTPRSVPLVDVATVRGWIMDELEDRNPDAFAKWMETNEEPEGFFQ